MIALNLSIRDEAYEKVIYILNSLPKQDVQILRKSIIEEIDPVSLPKDDFDYMSQKELNEIDKLLADAKKEGFENLKSFDELKDEL